MNGSDDNQLGPDVSAVPPAVGANPIAAEHLASQPSPPAMPAPMADQPAAPSAGIPMPDRSATSSATPLVTPPAAPNPGATQIPVSDASLAADDSDLIEKEWVHKAKYIVESTKNDPHLLNQELNKMKADYIQKRYNKQLKVSED